MPYTNSPFDDGPLGEDRDEGDDLPEMRCPACGAAVTEDTQKCPRCGDWITPVDPSSGGWRRWAYVAVILLMLYAILRWTF